MDKRTLDPTEIWHLSAQALHNDVFVTRYTDALESLIGNRSLEILDTACGSGFPTVPLYERGFTRITACDADTESVDRFRDMLRQSGADVPVFAAMWQELASKAPAAYDVLLNTDNSFVYMDAWEAGSEHARLHFKPGKDHAFERARIVLSNFRDVLRDGGMAIVGLGKHYVPPSRAYDTHVTASGEPILIDGHPIDIRWHCVMDWENRTHVWTETIRSETIEQSDVRKSYLFTKEEIAALFIEAGFSSSRVVTPEGTRDDLIIGIK